MFLLLLIFCIILIIYIFFNSFLRMKQMGSSLQGIGRNTCEFHYIIQELLYIPQCRGWILGCSHVGLHLCTWGTICWYSLDLPGTPVVHLDGDFSCTNCGDLFMCVLYQPHKLEKLQMRKVQTRASMSYKLMTVSCTVSALMPVNGVNL